MQFFCLFRKTISPNMVYLGKVQKLKQRRISDKKKVKHLQKTNL